MTFEEHNEELILPIEILDKNVMEKYTILAFINRKNKLKTPITAIEIMKNFKLKYKNTNRKMQILIKAKLIKKGERSNGYDSYIATKKAQKFLELFSKNFNIDKRLEK